MNLLIGTVVCVCVCDALALNWIEHAVRFETKRNERPLHSEAPSIPIFCVIFSSSSFSVVFFFVCLSGQAIVTDNMWLRFNSSNCFYDNEKNELVAPIASECDQVVNDKWFSATLVIWTHVIIFGYCFRYSWDDQRNSVCFFFVFFSLFFCLKQKPHGDWDF